MTSDIFKQIEELIDTLHGWCSVERACEFAAFVVALRPETTLVIGTWGGRDSISIALAHRHVGFGKVIVVDPWSAEASIDGEEQANIEWWGSQPRHDEVYAHFMSNVKRLGLENWMQIEKMKSDDFTPPNGIGLLVIDGNHAAQAIKDVRRYAPNVKDGGMLYADDIEWSSGSVKKAVKLLDGMGFKMLYKRDTGAFFQRVKS